MVVSSLSRCPHRHTPLCFLSESSRDTDSGRWPVGTHFGWLTPTGLSTDPPGSSKVTHDSSGLVFAREANPFCKQVSGPQSTRQPRSHEARQKWGDRHGPHLQHLFLGEHSLHTNILAELLSNSHTVIHTPPLGPLLGPGPILACYQGMGPVSVGRTRSLQMSRVPFWPPSFTSPRCL